MSALVRSIFVTACGLQLWLLGVLGNATAGPLIADSIADFSGTQGLNDWTYGYYDGDSTPYTPGDFELLPLFDGTKWLIQDGPTGYWTRLTASGGHPNGIVTAGRQSATHWAVRRWISDRQAPFTISGIIADDNPAINPPPPRDAYNGVVGHIFVDGTEVLTLPIDEGGNANYSLTVPLNAGSIVDFAIDPKTFASRPEWTADYTDMTTFTAQILVPEPSAAALLLLGVSFLASRRRLNNPPHLTRQLTVLTPRREGSPPAV